MPSYYLSEMNVSSKHGGGLTLMRILGDEMEEFDHFIRLVGYDIKGFESHPSVLSRELNLWEEPGDFETKSMPKRFTVDYIGNQLKRLLNLPNPKYINWDYYNKYYTSFLEKKIDFRQGRFLIVPQKPHSIKYTNYLYRKFGISYATWIMDDHLLGYDLEQEQYTYPANFQEEFQVHLKNARHVFVISPNMGEFYKQHFGVDYSVLFSPTDPAANFKYGALNVKGRLRFCHFGRVWKWPLDAVEKFAKKLEEIDAELDIYSYYELEGLLKKHPRVYSKVPVSGDEVIHKMKEYDAVTIFYGFSNEVRHFTEMNISTKMSECLASGIPTLFIGPEYAAMARFASKHRCGIVLTDLENEDQMEQVKSLRDTEFRKETVEQSLKVAKEHMSTKVMKQRWEEGWRKV